jgi:general secretion pathway protein M
VILPVAQKGRVLALVLALTLMLAAIAAVAVPAYVLHQRYDKVATEAEEKIDRYYKLASHRVEHQKALDALKAREGARFLLKNTSPTLAGAELTDLVRPMIEANGARLSSIQPTTVKDDSGFRLYSLNIGFNATPANLQKTLYAIETSMPYLFLENVTLRATVPRGYKPPPNQEPEVTAQVEVQAYGIKELPRLVRPGNTPAAAPAATAASAATKS